MDISPPLPQFRPPCDQASRISLSPIQKIGQKGMDKEMLPAAEFHPIALGKMPRGGLLMMLADGH
jgi:hypothetical protein